MFSDVQKRLKKKEKNEKIVHFYEYVCYGRSKRNFVDLSLFLSF